MTPPTDPIGPIDVEDLVGRPWSTGAQVGVAGDGGKSYRCYGLAREVMGRMGLWLPEDQADLLTLRDDLSERIPWGAPVRAGDVLIMRGAEGQHLAVCISETQFIHATPSSGVVLQNVSRFVAAGQVLGVCRPRKISPRGVDPEVRP